MLKIRKTALIALTVAVICIVCRADTSGQENLVPGVITVIDHEKLDASFTRAISNGGSELLWRHTSSKGTYNVEAHSRDSTKAACQPEGCSHKGYTAVVYVVSGAATLVIGGNAKTTAGNNFGGQSFGGGESHRISKGDMYIVPPDTVHWYKNIQAPFRYVEIAVP